MYFDKLKNYLFLSIIIFAVLIISIFFVNYHYKEEISIIDADCTKIAVLDGEKLKNTAKCFRAHEKIALMINDLLDKMKRSETEIKAEYDKIKNNSKLSQNQKLKNISKIETKWVNLSAQYNSQMQTIKNMDLSLSNHIQKRLGDVIEAISKSAKFNVVLNKGSRDSILVFYNSKNIDITDLVIQKLDKILPDVDLKEIQK
jgi:Skp family chaperone for outer membrane proteins